MSCLLLLSFGASRCLVRAWVVAHWSSVRCVWLKPSRERAVPGLLGLQRHRLLPPGGEGRLPVRFFLGGEVRGRGSRFPAGAGRGLGGDLPGLAPSDGGFCPPPFFALAASSRPPPPRLDAYEGNPRGRQSNKGCQPRAFHRLRGLPGTTLHSCPGVDGSKADVFHARGARFPALYPAGVLRGPWGATPRCTSRRCCQRAGWGWAAGACGEGGCGRVVGGMGRGLAGGSSSRQRSTQSIRCATAWPNHALRLQSSPTWRSSRAFFHIRKNQYMVSAMKMALGGAFARYVFSRAVQRAVQSRAV